MVDYMYRGHAQQKLSEGKEDRKGGGKWCREVVSGGRWKGLGGVVAVRGAAGSACSGRGVKRGKALESG